jgi:hypothetical protein
MIKEKKEIKKIITTLIISVIIPSEFSNKLIISINIIDTHNGKKEVKIKQNNMILDILYSPISNS